MFHHRCESPDVRHSEGIAEVELNIPYFELGQQQLELSEFDDGAENVKSGLEILILLRSRFHQPLPRCEALLFLAVGVRY